jgi:hypothetical protein
VTAEHSARRINAGLRTVLDWATAQAHEQYRIQVLASMDPYATSSTSALRMDPFPVSRN